MKRKILGIIVVLAFFLTTIQAIGMENNRLKQEISVWNSPPNTPEISVPDQGQVREPTWISMWTTDPNDDEVKYIIDWGDGEESESMTWINSGVLFKISHKYKYEADFIVRVKAKDYYDAESGWAIDEIEVPISLTKSSPYQNHIFLKFLENHPYLFLLIKQILEIRI